MSIAVLTPDSGPNPPPRLLTAGEFVQHYPNHRKELIRGVVKEVPVPFAKHGYVCMELGRLIANFAKERGLGRVMSNDSFVQTERDPDTVVGADVCFYSFDRLPKGPIPDGLLPVVPDLVAEVRSPSNTWTELFGKAGDYLKAGVRAVVLIDPPSETAMVLRDQAEQVVFQANEELVIPEVLPGFAVTVGRLFE
jgi:Uma2 family endonuclease